jgi:hypothetical protein
MTCEVSWFWANRGYISKLNSKQKETSLPKGVLAPLTRACRETQTAGEEKADMSVEDAGYLSNTQTRALGHSCY